MKLTIVDSRDTRPEFLFLQPWKRVRGLLSRVAPLPLAVSVAFNQVVHRVGCILKHVRLSRYLTLFNFADLLTDTDESINESVKLLFALTFRWLDHQCIGNWPAHGGRMKAVILKTLGDVNSLDTSGFAEGPSIENELMGASALLIDVEDLVVRFEARKNVVGIKQRNLRGMCKSISA